MSNPLHIQEELCFDAAPVRLYRALIDAAEHAAFTGASAEGGSEEGDRFSHHGGYIWGRNIELVPGRRIVQAWRTASWPEGVYSIVRYEMSTEGAGTKLVFDHIGFPEGDKESLTDGWRKHYWEPLRKHLA
jgi:activator of HSP90 ATPase